MNQVYLYSSGIILGYTKLDFNSLSSICHSTLFKNYSKCRICILACSTNFCPIKSDLSGNIAWPQASGFQKLAIMDHFWHFKWTFVHSKCKRISLRSQCCIILFLWFSNTVSLESLKNIIVAFVWMKYIFDSFCISFSDLSRFEKRGTTKD